MTSFATGSRRSSTCVSTRALRRTNTTKKRVTEGAADRDRNAHRAAPKGRGILPNYAGKPDFIGFACGRTGAFESRTKAPASCLCVFEPSAQRKKLEFSLCSPFDLTVNRASWACKAQIIPLKGCTDFRRPVGISATETIRL